MDIDMDEIFGDRNLDSRQAILTIAIGVDSVKNGALIEAIKAGKEITESVKLENEYEITVRILPGDTYIIYVKSTNAEGEVVFDDFLEVAAEDLPKMEPLYNAVKELFEGDDKEE